MSRLSPLFFLKIPSGARDPYSLSFFAGLTEIKDVTQRSLSRAEIAEHFSAPSAILWRSLRNVFFEMQVSRKARGYQTLHAFSRTMEASFLHANAC